MVMMRLQKVLAEAGYGSRRACETYIQAGRVFVDDVPVTRLGAKADPDIQRITVDGIPVRLPRKYYFLVNKPVGYICTNKPDATGRPLAVDLVRVPGVRLFCVGRLDVDSKGALIVTNDGDLSQRVTHPRYDVPKTYRVRVQGRVETAVLDRLRKGVWLSEGRTGSIDVKVIREARKETVLKLTIKEGKNRIVRRVMAKLGLKVTELERTRVGPVVLGRLKPGAYRPLKAVEINRLKAARPGKGSRKA